MNDLVVLVIAGGFAALTCALVYLCDRLAGGGQ
jgi:hypothetical protein